MKPFLRSLAIALALAVLTGPPAAQAGDKHKDKYKKEDNSEVRALREDLQHTRAMENHVHDMINTTGSNREIQVIVNHITAEMNHVDDELNTGYVQVDHVRAELGHIHEELHQAEEMIHDRDARRSREDRGDSYGGRGGYTIRIR